MLPTNQIRIGQPILRTDAELVLRKGNGDLVTGYDDFLAETRVTFDQNNKNIVMQMFENATYISSRVQTAMATYNRTMWDVVKDVAKHPVGNRVLAANTIYQYIKCNTFLTELKVFDPELHNRLKLNAEKGMTKFSHVLVVSRSSNEMQDKVDILRKHIDGDTSYISKKALEVQLNNVHDSSGDNSTNVWMEDSIMFSFLRQYVPTGEDVFAPFGTEGPEHPRIKTFPYEFQSNFIKDGFVDENGEVIGEETQDNVLLHLPQYNTIYRSNSEGGRYRYQNFPAYEYEDFINRFEFMVHESWRVLKRNGTIGIVCWNIEWGKEMPDQVFAARQMIEEKFEWVNTVVVSMEGRLRSWYPRQAYRILHVAKKL